MKSEYFCDIEVKGEELQSNHGKLQTLYAKSSLPEVILLFGYNFSFVANSQELAVYVYHPRATARIEDRFHLSPLRQVCRLKQTKLQLQRLVVMGIKSHGCIMSSE